MVNCPRCGKELAKPNKKLENFVFFIAVFTYDECETQLKVVH
jgi:hypothetical protein